jgi:hypothetical protein
MRSLVILAAVCFSTSAYAQDAPPKVGNKSLAQVKPKEPMGCKLVGMPAQLTRHRRRKLALQSQRNVRRDRQSKPDIRSQGRGFFHRAGFALTQPHVRQIDVMVGQESL